MAFRLIKEKNEINEEVKVSFPVKLIGSGLFTGFIPLASGTFGSLIGLGIYMLPHVSEFYYLVLIILFLFLLGVYTSEKMRSRYGEDPPEVVIDEITGQLFTYLIGSIMFELFFPFKSFDPGFDTTAKISFAVIGFFAFRFFDIVKLEPSKYFDNKNSGLGIMLDDIAAALYAGIFTSVLTHFVWYQLLRKYFG
jgi:phosphatidylglycerophosphatase A